MRFFAMKYGHWMGVSVLGAAALTAFGCAAATTQPPAGTEGGSTPTTTSGAGGGTTASAGTGGSDAGSGGLAIGSGGSTGGDTCPDEAKLIYLLGKTQELYSFDPGALALTKVGIVDCPQSGGTATPFSMSIDRSGTAWVLYNDGHMYHVDTKTAACTATSFVPGQAGYKKFGMGFVSDAPGSTAETLHVANEIGIATINAQTLTVTPKGSFGFSAAAELTGTGDARLFGFFFGFPPYIAEINKATSALLAEAPLDTVDAGTGFAFAFWGGDFWVFTAPNGSSSQIDRYKPATKTTTTVKMNLGFKVVGAGVSTCAPLVDVPK
jgi:hypothetical protein